MFALDLTSGQLARLSGANINRVQRWLKGDDETPVYIQRDLEIWRNSQRAFELAVEWADAHAQDVRDDE